MAARFHACSLKRKTRFKIKK